MRLRPRRGNLVIWSSSGVPDGGSWAWASRLPAADPVVAPDRHAAGAHRGGASGPDRADPLGTRVPGCGRHARGDRASALPAAWLAFLFGLLVLVVTLLKGIRTKGRGAGQAADCWQWRG